MKDFLIDTDVIIDYLKAYKPAISYLEKISKNLLLSVITVAELYAGIRDIKEKEILETFLKAFEIIATDHHIAKEAGIFRKKYGKSHGTGLADALIAATALHCNAKLITLNGKHYPMVETIKPYSKA